ncbi:MAG: DUF1801 domain-containing protein [Polyangiales bacterium]
MSEAKTTTKDIDQYIATFPGDVQEALQAVRATIHKAAPAAAEAMKYQIPTFVLYENLVHFAGYKTHIGFYPSPSGIAQFARELSRYKGAKGSVQFPLDEPMPIGLITKIVKFRVKEVQAKARKSPGKKSPTK